MEKTAQVYYFDLPKKKAYFHKDFVMYPFVTYDEIKPTVVHIPKDHYSEVLPYIDHFGYSHI